MFWKSGNETNIIIMHVSIATFHEFIISSVLTNYSIY